MSWTCRPIPENLPRWVCRRCRSSRCRSSICRSRSSQCPDGRSGHPFWGLGRYRESVDTCRACSIRIRTSFCSNCTRIDLQGEGHRLQEQRHHAQEPPAGIHLQLQELHLQELQLHLGSEYRHCLYPARVPQPQRQRIILQTLASAKKKWTPY